MDKRILPDGYHIGAPIGGASRQSLFRPTQPISMIYPGIEMIFYNTYWFKHILYCNKKYKILNRNANSQEQLAYFFLPIPKDFDEDNITSREKLIERAKDSIFYNLIIDLPETFSDTFPDWASGSNYWLFQKKEWLKDLKANVTNWQSLDEEKIINDLRLILGGGLISHLNAKGIDIKTAIKDNYIAHLKDKEFSLPIKKEQLVAELSIFLWHLICVSGEKRDNPIRPNITFMELNLLPADLSYTPELEMLANKNYSSLVGYTDLEIEKLLLSMERTESGRIILDSIILTDCLLDCENMQDVNEQIYRSSYNSLKDKKRVVNFIQKNYSFLKRTSQDIYSSLLVSSVAWEWNLFLLDGERIIKNVLFDAIKDEEGFPIDALTQAMSTDEKATVSILENWIDLDDKKIKSCQYFNTASHFLISISKNPEKLDQLSHLIMRDNKRLKPLIIEFLNKNIELAKKSLPLNEIFVELLKINQDISISDELMWFSSDITVSSPNLTGLDAFIGVFTTLRRGENAR